MRSNPNYISEVKLHRHTEWAPTEHVILSPTSSSTEIITSPTASTEVNVNLQHARSKQPVFVNKHSISLCIQFMVYKHIRIHGVYHQYLQTQNRRQSYFLLSPDAKMLGYILQLPTFLLNYILDHRKPIRSLRNCLASSRLRIRIKLHAGCQHAL